MGGTVALTIRFSPGDEYRGSCWTNVLPVSLWASPFYKDLGTSREHTRGWLEALKKHRAADPGLEAIWGGWNKLAPLEYGIVVVDYVTSTLVSLQGYSYPQNLYVYPHDEEEQVKWRELEAMSLLYDYEQMARRRKATIKLPFETTILGHEGMVRKGLPWCKKNFDLSREERLAWVEFIRRRNR